MSAANVRACSLTPSQVDAMSSLRLCMLCPAQCRRFWERSQPEQSEVITPSSLAMLAVFVAQDVIVLDESVRQALQRRDMAKVCRAGCPHDLDVAGSIDCLVGERLEAGAR